MKRSPTALCDRQKTQCRADKKCSYIVNLWGGPSHGAGPPRSDGPQNRSRIPPERNPGYAPDHGDMKLDVSNITYRPHYIGRNGHEKKISKIQSRLLSYHNSFFPKTVRDWNTFSSSLVETNSVVEFKELLSTTDTHM